MKGIPPGVSSMEFGTTNEDLCLTIFKKLAAGYSSIIPCFILMPNMTPTVFVAGHKLYPEIDFVFNYDRKVLRNSRRGERSTKHALPTSLNRPLKMVFMGKNPIDLSYMPRRAISCMSKKFFIKVFFINLYMLKISTTW